MEYLKDLIHLTQGELLVKYWWVWLIVIAIAVAYELFKNKTDKF